MILAKELLATSSWLATRSDPNPALRAGSFMALGSRLLELPLITGHMLKLFSLAQSSGCELLLSGPAESAHTQALHAKKKKEEEKKKKSRSASSAEISGQVRSKS